MLRKNANAAWEAGEASDSREKLAIYDKSLPARPYCGQLEIPNGGRVKSKLTL